MNTSHITLDTTIPTVGLIVHATSPTGTVSLNDGDKTQATQYSVSCTCGDSSGCDESSLATKYSVNQGVWTSFDTSFTLSTSGLDGMESNITFMCEEKDNAGNIGIGNITAIFDKKGPTVEIIEPPNGFTQTTTPLIRVRTNEHASYCTLEYTPISGPTNQQTVTMSTVDGFLFSHQIDSLNPLYSQQDNPIAITCEDDYGNVNTEYETITLDEEKPHITGVELTSVTSYLEEEDENYAYFMMYSGSTTKIKVTATDNSGGVRCKYDRDNVAFSDMDYAFENFTMYLNEITTQDLVFQIYETRTYYIKCQDQGGLISDNTYEVKITLDPTLPIKVIYLEPGEYTNQGDPEIKIRSSLDADCTIEYSGQGSEDMDKTTTGGMYYHTIQASQTGASPLDHETDYPFTVECDSLVDGIQDSDPTVISFHTDFYVDPPTISEPSEQYITESPITIMGVTEEDANVTIYLNGEFIANMITNDGNFIVTDVILTQPGTQTIHVAVIDKAGNQNSAEKQVLYTVEGPNSRIIYPQDGDILREVPYVIAEITTSDGTPVDLGSSNLDVFMYETELPGSMSTDSGEGTITRTFTPVLTTDAFYSAISDPVDDLGRSGLMDEIHFEIDKKAPVIILESPYTELPYSGEVVINYDQVLNGTIQSRHDLTEAYVIINDQPKADLSLSGIFSKAFTLHDGLNTFMIYAKDIIGNEGIVHGDIYLDRTGPTVTLEEPLNGMTTTTTPKIVVKTDEYATQCDITFTGIGGGVTRDMTTDLHYIFEYTIPASDQILEEKDNTMYISCTDIYGNVKDNNLIVIFVDTKKPTIDDVQLSTPANFITDEGFMYKELMVYGGSATRLLVTASDNSEGGVRCKYDTSEKDYEDMSYTFDDYFNYSNNPQSPEISIFDKQIYEYYILCEDQAGFITEYPFHIKFTVNYNAPIGIRFIEPGEYTNLDDPEIVVQTSMQAEACELWYDEGMFTEKVTMTGSVSDGKYIYKATVSQTSALMFVLQSLDHLD
jgi:hypothetical protein